MMGGGRVGASPKRHRPLTRVAAFAATGLLLAFAGAGSLGASSAGSGAPSSTAPPSVEGTARAGETLTATPGSWSGSEPMQHAYEWLRCAPGYAQLVSARSPVGYWRLGESSGTTAADLSGRGHTGSYSGTYALAQAGALALDGDTAVRLGSTSSSSGTMSVPHRGTLNVADTVTYELWLRLLRLPSSSGGVDLVAKGSGPLVLRVLPSGVLTLRRGGGSELTRSTTALAVDGTYHHVVAVKAGSVVRIYVDGADVTGAVSNSSLSNSSSALTLRASELQALVDEFAVYTRGLTADEVSAGSAAGRDGVCAPLAGATEQSHTLGVGDVGAAMRVQVTATNALGSATALSATTAVVAPPNPPVNTAAPAIDGLAREGETLTASPGSWDGTQPIEHAYEWRSCDASGGGCAAIAGATGAAYEPAAGDVGATLRVAVTASNIAGSATAVSDTTATVVGVSTPPANVEPPAVAGEARVGETLTAAPGTWSGSKPIAYAFEWQRCDASGEACGVIWEASGSSYALSPGDVGGTVRVAVTASNEGGWAAAVSAPTAMVVPESTAPANVEPPSVSGEARAGETLTAAPGTWSGTEPIGYAYQWRRCDTGCTAIPGATGSSYQLTDADIGSTIRVAVTATNAGGSGTAVSEATATVAALPPDNTAPPTISGEARTGETLTATTGTWTGTQPIAYAYQWRRCDTGCTAIPGATGTSYQLTDTDIGATIRVAVTAANAGGSGTAVSEATATVAALPADNTAPPTISGEARTGETLTATTGTWTGTQPIAYTYQWRRCDANGAGCVPIPGATATSYELTYGDVGATLRIAVTATNVAGSASALSAATGVVTPPPTPPTNDGPPTVDGEARAGNTLSAAPGTWSGTQPISYAYQWRRCSSTYSQLVQAAGPVAYWRLGESAGSTATDASGLGNEGTYSGSYALGQQGALALDQNAGVRVGWASPSGTVVVGHRSSLNVGDSVTYETWVQLLRLPSASTVGANIATKSVGTLVLRILPSGILSLRKSGGSELARSSVPLAVGAGYQHVVAVKSGPEVRVYVDGVDVTVPITNQPLTNNTTNLTIAGNSPAENRDGIDGYLDEFALYGRGLSASEVAAHYAAGREGTCAPIGGATGQTYTVGTADVGSALRVAVTATNEAGSATAESEPTALVPVTAGPPDNTAPPTVAGILQAGATLASWTGAWTGEEPIAYAYQWRRCDSSGECADIPGATDESYVLREEDMGARIRVAVTASNVEGSATAVSAPTNAIAFGYGGPSSLGAGERPTASKPQSKLWWNDGSWWVTMWSTAAGSYTIFRLDLATQTWIDTGTPIDARGNTRADALWDGSHLYVSTHVLATCGCSTPSFGKPSRLYRYSYDAAAAQYSLDAGFPVAINDTHSETLVIDKDSTGTIWATWAQSNQVYVNRTLGDDRTWGTPFALPFAEAQNLHTDDISSVVAFGGDRIGVMWSNQNANTMYFAVHRDVDAAGTWQAPEVALNGTRYADDHINLHADGDGRVLVAMKTSRDEQPGAPSTDPQMMVLERAAGGTWTGHVAGTVANDHTRPILLVDEESRRIHLFATAPTTPGGTIYHKASQLDAIGFPAGLGTPFMRGPGGSGVSLNDATATKQSVTSATGIVVVASERPGDRYWHNYLRLGGGPAPGDATPPVLSAISVAAGSGSATVTWATDEPATSTVVYGTTPSYGQLRSSGSLVTSHGIQLTGLTCATTYHYRVRSTDAAGNTATSDDATFVTQACPAAGPYSDEFDGDALDLDLWRVYDPVGDVSVSVSTGRLRIALPEGVRHDLWSGALEAPRVLQRVPNGDFDVMAKFDSPVSLTYQLQGLVAQADAGNFVRFETHFANGDTRVFAATFVSGEPTVRANVSIPAGAPVYLRMTREGSTWTLRSSHDAVAWTTAGTFSFDLSLTELGLFAGNVGSPPPGFTARIDSFHVLGASSPPPDPDPPPPDPDPPPGDTTPPAISAVAATTDATSATVTWTTDEPADSRVEYGPTSAYGETRSQSTLVTSHSLAVSGLTCETTYHYRVSSADAAGNRATGSDRTLTTAACPTDPGGVRSDEFDGSSLDPRWRVLDPRGETTVSVADGRLRIALPAGSAHDLWEGALTAPRVLQSTVDGDFEIEAKLDSAVAQAYQSQGLVAHAGASDLVRFDVYSTGGDTRVFAATFVNGQATIRAQQAIASGAPVYLRMGRAGSTWTLRYSHDGSSWTTAATFGFALALREFGLFAANPITGVAFTAQVDYFRVLSEAAPPPPDPGDTVPPVISGVAATAGTTTATVTWTTDEPADSRVEFGLTPSYGETRSKPDLATSHSVTLGVLQCETTYHYRVSSADAAGNRATGQDRTFTTLPCASAGGPAIDVWYGDAQTFGELGFPQRWLNILGKASDPDGLRRLEYRVDGGPATALVYDPAQNLRIGRYGDFNIELDRHALAPGRHLVTIRAEDGLGNESTRVVEVDVRSGATWPLPFEVDWTAGLTRTAQVVDGFWTIEGQTVRTVERGYDRAVAIGDESWASVDATVAVTVHAFDASADHAGVGFATGWRGHEGFARPRGEWPLGGLCFYYRHLPGEPYWLHLIQYGSPMFVSTDWRPNWLPVGVEHLFRMRVEPTSADSARYSCKVWRAGDPEPSAWNVEAVLPKRAGSLLLVADHADVSFGAVTVRSATE